MKTEPTALAIDCAITDREGEAPAEPLHTDIWLGRSLALPIKNRKVTVREGEAPAEPLHTDIWLGRSLALPIENRKVTATEVTR